MTSAEPPVSEAALPLVTLGIPTFNRVESLERALASACAQSYAALEIVVSDNASTDGTRELLERVAAEDDRVRPRFEEVNRGATANFESVLRAARGELFMWLADDDWLDPAYVERCVDRMREEPEATLVAGAVAYYRDGRYERQEAGVDLASPRPVKRILGFARTVNRNGVFYGLARTEHWRLFAPLRNCIAEDWCMVAGLAARGAVHTLPDVRIHRRVEGYGDVGRIASSLGHGRAAVFFARPLAVVSVVHDILFHPAFDVLSRGQRRIAAAGVAPILSWKALRSLVLSGLARIAGLRRWEKARRRLGRSQRVAGSDRMSD